MSSLSEHVARHERETNAAAAAPQQADADAMLEHIASIRREQMQRAEDDLVCILGERASWPARKIKRLGYEVAYQYVSDEALLPDYRGIRRRGKWVIDHYPNWPQPTEEIQ